MFICARLLVVSILYRNVINYKLVLIVGQTGTGFQSLIGT